MLLESAPKFFLFFLFLSLICTSPVFAAPKVASTSVTIRDAEPEEEEEEPPAEDPDEPEERDRLRGGGTVITSPKIIELKVFQDVGKNVHIEWKTNTAVKSTFSYGFTSKFEIDSIWESEYDILHRVVLKNIKYDKEYLFQIMIQTPKGSSATRVSYFVFHTTSLPETRPPETIPSSSVPFVTTTPAPIISIPRVEVGPLKNPNETEIPLVSPSFSFVPSTSTQTVSSTKIVSPSSSLSEPRDEVLVTILERSNTSFTGPSPVQRAQQFWLDLNPLLRENGNMTFIPIVWTTAFAPLSIFYNTIFWPIWFLFI